MKIVVDAMGGDYAPEAAVRGAVEAKRETDAEIVLVGQIERIHAVLADCGVSDAPDGITLVDARETIAMAEEPVHAIRTKKDSSIVVGLRMLRDGEADAFVSAGSSGALLTGATLLVKRLPGVRRCAFAPQLPNAAGGSFFLLDSGANAECSEEYLVQFARLGSIHARAVLGIEKPRVGLLNIGTEEEKGDTLRRNTHKALRTLSEQGELCFVGNLEARDAMFGACDVLVADGFSGNVMLKTMEGTALFITEKLKETLRKNLKTKLAALLLMNDLKEFKRLLDPREQGGTALLGASAPVFKAHGSSDAYAIRNAIRQAARAVEQAKKKINEKKS